MLFDLTLAIEAHDRVVGKANQDQNSFMSRGHIGTHLEVHEKDLRALHDNRYN